MRNNINLGLYILLFVSVLGCGDKTNFSESNTNNVATEGSSIQVSEAQFVQQKMTLGKFKKYDFPTVVKANGEIDVPPESRVVISAPLGGYLKNTPLLVGDVVKKGQVLLTIENPEFLKLQQEYLEVKAQLEYLQSEFERQKIMVAEQITSKKNYLKAQSAYNTALARENGLREQLNLLHINVANVAAGNMSSETKMYAPISGSVTSINSSRGAYVSPETPIMEIIDNEHIHIELSVFEKDVMKLKKGQKINFKVPESSERLFAAQVYLIGTDIEANRTIKVHGHLDNEAESDFLTGMFVSADIVVQERTSNALPASSVVTIDDQSYILILEEHLDDRYFFKQVEVATGQVYDNYIEILYPLTINDNVQVVTNGAFNLIVEGI